MKHIILLLALCATFFAKANGYQSPVRQLIRGGTSSIHDQEAGAKDNEERDLGRVKARNGGGGSSDSSGDSSSKGSKGGSSSKGSKGSKSGSKGSKGRSGRRRRRRSGPSCGIDCGNKDYAYIYLEGSYFLDSLTITPPTLCPLKVLESSTVPRMAVPFVSTSRISRDTPSTLITATPTRTRMISTAPSLVAVLSSQHIQVSLRELQVSYVSPIALSALPMRDVAAASLEALSTTSRATLGQRR